MIHGRLPQKVPEAAWFRSGGTDLDVVVTTRCRIARNLDEYPFPGRATETELAQITRVCRQVLAGLEPTARVFERTQLTGDEIADLVLGRFVSFRWAHSTQPGLVQVDSSGVWSVMVNEEDHLRIQTIAGGFEPQATTEQALALSSRLKRHMRLAYRPPIGHLTASLSNAGTGLRLSFLLHIPALAQDARYVETLAAAEHMGCSIRGAFGEGTRGTGALVQVSNRCTYGTDATYSQERVTAAARYLVEREREARGSLLARPRGRSDIRDACEGARNMLLTSEPPPDGILQCVSYLRLGMALGAMNGDLLRTGKWMALAGVAVWASRRTGLAAARFERMRCLARIRAGLCG